MQFIRENSLVNRPYSWEDVQLIAGEDHDVRDANAQGQPHQRADDYNRRQQNKTPTKDQQLAQLATPDNYKHKERIHKQREDATDVHNKDGHTDGVGRLLRSTTS